MNFYREEYLFFAIFILYLKIRKQNLQVSKQKARFMRAFELIKS